MIYLEGNTNKTIFKNKLIKDEKHSLLVVDMPNKKNEDGTDNGNEIKTEFDINGLSLKFAGLKNEKDILKFSNTYGLLGIGHKNVEHLNCDYCYMINFEYNKTAVTEWIEEWQWHVKHINSLYKLYEALKDERAIEDDLLRLKKWSRFSHSCFDNSYSIPVPTPTSFEENQRKNSSKDALHFFWAKSKSPTLLNYSKPDKDLDIEEEYRGYAFRIIQAHIIHMIKDSVFVDFHSIRVDHDSAYLFKYKDIELGLSYSDKKATNYLLTAIYYDLYRTVNNLEKVDFCEKCGNPFKGKRKDAKWCSNKCRQAKKNANPKEGVVVNG